MQQAIPIWSEGKPLSAIELLNKGLDNVNTKGVKNISMLKDEALYVHIYYRNR